MPTILLAVWVAALGACLGSFLNVVIYRLPRGMSLSWPGSHCPACKKPIRWYDNLPVVGWLKLGGRCRDCGAVISARYPAVEALIAAAALALAVVDIFWVTEPWPPVATVLFDPNSWARLFVHLLLVCTLIAAALIAHDGKSRPLRLFVPALLLGLIAPAIWHGVRRSGAVWPLSEWMLAGVDRAIIEGASGVLAGLLAGLLAWPGLAPSVENRVRLAGVAALITVGACLGWQSVGLVAAAAMALTAVAALAARVSGVGWLANAMAALAAVVFIWVISRARMGVGIPRGGAAEFALIVIPGVLIAIASLAYSLVRSDDSVTPGPRTE